MAKYALVIGIQTYGGHGFGNLTKPAEEAEAIAQLLEAHGDFNKVDRLPHRWNQDKNNFEVSSDPVTGAELGTKIRQFFENIGRNEAFLYFSGHGYEITDNLGRKSGYLVASDSSTETVSSTGVPLESLNQLIIESDCSSIVTLLDCCHAGRLLDKSLITSSLTAFNAGDRNYFLATACRSHEKAYEGLEYSLFTAAVIKALKLPGTDGIVRTARLNQVIDDELRGSGQEPVVLKSGSEITLVTYPNPEPSNQEQTTQRLPRIRGLAPYRDQIRKGGFRSYLSSELLPYYSRSAHLSLDPAPDGVKISEEAELLHQLNQEDAMGLVITGIGGIGKTRLMLEIGHLALAEGWLVFRVKERMESKGVYELADSVDPSQKVLLLIDYAETQQEFSELVHCQNLILG